jgi:hypothetical protein
VSDTVQITMTRDDAERLGGIAYGLETLPAHLRRYYDEDGRDSRYLRIQQERIFEALAPRPRRQIKGQMSVDECIAEAAA